MQNCRFLTSLEDQYQKRSPIDIANNVAQQRHLALQKALEVGPPHSKLATWKYATLEILLDTAFNIDFPHLSEKSHQIINEKIGASNEPISLVFVNGLYNQQLSKIDTTSELIITSLRELEKNDEKMFQHIFEQTHHSPQFFQKINSALARDGAVIFIPDNCHIATPIMVYHCYVNETQQPIMINSQTHIILGNNAKGLVFEKSITLGAVLFANAQTFLTCQKEAELVFGRISDNVNPNYHINHLFAAQSQNSSLKMVDFVLGGNYHRNETYYTLQEPDAKTDCYTLILPRAQQHYDCVSHMAHYAPHCHSSQLIKSIAENEAHSSFQGIILVKNDAPQTVAKMKNENLFLGNKGKIDTVPQLEILTDDVQCHHGASVSSVDETSLFYLLARGLNENEAKKMLIFAFIEDIVAELPLAIKVTVAKTIQQHVAAMIATSLP